MDKNELCLVKNELCLVFYTPLAEMLESEPYVADFTVVQRAQRLISNEFNELNATWMAKSLHLNANSGEAIFKKADASSVPNNANGEGGGGSLSSAGFLRIASDWACNWNEEEYASEMDRMFGQGDQTDGYSYDIFARAGEEPSHSAHEAQSEVHSPRCCHVEILFGGLTYSIRWGELLCRQEGKNYAGARGTLSPVNLSLSKASKKAFLEFCEKAIFEIDGFNHGGIYVNFLMPKALKSCFLSNGSTYRGNRGNTVFCSEFVARALCVAGVFEDVTGEFTAVEGTVSSLWESVKDKIKLSLKAEVSGIFSSGTVDPMDFVGIRLTENLRVEIEPSMMSPNSLSLALYLQRHICQLVGAHFASEDAWSPYRGRWIGAINWGMPKNSAAFSVPSADAREMSSLNI